MRVFEKVIEANLIKLKRLGYDSIQTKTQYEKFRYKGDTTITLYTSGKLTIAGKKENEEKAVKFLIAEKIIKIIKQDYEYDFDSNDIYIGCDESLKGDTFGGICLSIFCANKKIRKDLVEIGVKDSKKIIDEKIIYMAKDIMKKYPDNYLTKSIEPYEYNILTQSHNVTQLLNSVYKNMILKLTSKFKINKIYVDKYPGAKIIGIENIIYLEKGESKIIEIAAASIISRYYALKQIEKLNKKVNFYIPKGSTHVKVALTELKNKKLSKINFVKLHFRNTQ